MYIANIIFLRVCEVHVRKPEHQFLILMSHSKSESTFPGCWTHDGMPRADQPLWGNRIADFVQPRHTVANHPGELAEEMTSHIVAWLAQWESTQTHTHRNSHICGMHMTAQKLIPHFLWPAAGIQIPVTDTFRLPSTISAVDQRLAHCSKCT